MENDEVAQVVADDAGVAQAMVEASDAAQVVATEAQEIAQAADDTIAAAGDAETLEKVQEVVQGTVDSGQGMDETTAQVAQVVVESICNRLGIVNSHKLMPATESFGSSNTRLAATKVALENAFTDTIKRIWEAIKKFVKSTWEKIKMFFARFFENTAKVIKAAEAMQMKVREISGKSAKETKFENRGLYKLFGFENKMAVKAISDNHLNLTKGTADFIKKGKDLIASISKGIESKNIDVESLANKAKETLEAVMGTSAVLPAANRKTDSDSKQKVTAQRSGPFVGGQTLNVIETLNTQSQTVSVAITFEDLGYEGDAKKEVPTLTQKEIGDSCTFVIDLMKATADYKKAMPDIEALGKATANAADSVLKIAETLTSEATADVKRSLSDIRGLFTDYTGSVTKLTVMTPSWNVKLGKGLLTYCQLSMAQYK
jgi:hypothetical protein